MAMASTPTADFNPQVIITFWPYIAVFIIAPLLAVTSFQFLRVLNSTMSIILRLIIRTLLFIFFLPIYLLLLPLRVLIFFTRLTVKVMYFVATATILYSLLHVAFDTEMFRKSFEQIVEYVRVRL